MPPSSPTDDRHVRIRARRQARVPDFNVFFRYFATYPYYSDAIWYLTQMRRWGQIGEQKADDWYAATAKSVYRPDVYLEAARLLVEEGLASEQDFPWTTDGYREPQDEFIDGIVYDGRKPNAYLETLAIGLKGADTPTSQELLSAE
jgi:nitrate/nitrite transport system substrate-binding protein